MSQRLRLIHFTPGTGTFHCGSCLRDNALIKALRVRGYDAVMVPLYLPLVTDREPASPEQAVLVGGISLYLQQKMPWFHHLPRWFHRWLNKPDRLRWASRLMGMTSAKDLGEMTVGSLLGNHGRQWGEWHKVIDWLKSGAKPDVISFSNSLLTGLAPAIAKEVAVPVICSLQGEDSFLDTLPEPYREQSWQALRENAKSVRRFVAPSGFYAGVMEQRLELAAGTVSVIPNGMDLTAYPVAEPDPNWPVIGYFARMIHGKGLTTLVDAFIEIVSRGRLPRLKLKIGGAETPADVRYVKDLQDKLKAAGCLERVQFHPNLSLQDKLRFFRDLTVFSVPATYGEAFGLYVIEAVACGVPVVEPEHGAFPELVAATQGGVLCAPDDVTALADGLESLLLDEQKRDQLANRGMSTVRAEFTAVRMAERFDAVVRDVLSSQA